MPVTLLKASFWHRQVWKRCHNASSTLHHVAISCLATLRRRLPKQIIMTMLTYTCKQRCSMLRQLTSSVGSMSPYVNVSQYARDSAMDSPDLTESMAPSSQRCGVRRCTVLKRWVTPVDAAHVYTYVRRRSLVGKRRHNMLPVCETLIRLVLCSAYFARWFSSMALQKHGRLQTFIVIS